MHNWADSQDRHDETLGRWSVADFDEYDADFTAESMEIKHLEWLDSGNQIAKQKVGGRDIAFEGWNGTEWKIDQKVTARGQAGKSKTGYEVIANEARNKTPRAW